MSLNLVSRQHRRRGNVLTEFALIFPLLLLLCFGVGDFARVFFHGITISHAAGSGAFYAAQSNIHSGHYSESEQVARNDSADVERLAPVQVQVERYCDCPDQPAAGPTDPNAVNCLTASCPSDGYGLPRLFVRARTQQNFTPFLPLPGIPRNVVASRAVYMRVQ